MGLVKQKQCSLIRAIILMTFTLIIMFNLQTKVVYASDNPNAAANWAGAIVDSMGIGNQGGTDEIQKGLSYSKTGYLCYVLTAEGDAVPGTSAVALKSPGYTQYDGSIWYCSSRKGNYTTSTWKGDAPWKLTPWQEGGKVTNEPAIKAWFEKMDGNQQNAIKFVYKNWDEDVAEKYISGEYIIVIETIMHFQYSTANNSKDLENANRRLESKIVYLENCSDYNFMVEAKDYGYKMSYEVYKLYIEKKWDFLNAGNTVQADKYDKLAKEKADKIRGDLVSALRIEFDKRIANMKGARQLLGDPVIGTVPNLLDYASFNNFPTKTFDSYLRNTALFAEMIESNGPGVKAGFKYYDGSTAESVRLSDAEVNRYGLAMVVLSNELEAINTYDPSEGSPGKAEDPNPGKVGTTTIVKGYYTEDELTQTKISDGVYTQPNTTNKINIMEEPEYQLVSWNISTDAPTTPDPAGAWISTPKGGITPTSVTLETNEKTLYVLLKKVEAAPPEVGNELWVLNESEITAQVSTANKAATNGTDLKLTVTLPTLEKCNGHYKEADPGHSADCEETCTQSHKYGWTDYCTSWTLDDKSFSLITKNTNEDDTATSKNVLAKDSLTSRNILFRNQVKAYPESSGKCFIFFANLFVKSYIRQLAQKHPFSV